MSINLTDSKIFPLTPNCGQVAGVLESILPAGEDIVAAFGCPCPHCGKLDSVNIAFPGRIAGMIEPHVGERILVLRNGEDYHVKVLEASS